MPKVEIMGIKYRYRVVGYPEGRMETKRIKPTKRTPASQIVRTANATQIQIIESCVRASCQLQVQE